MPIRPLRLPQDLLPAANMLMKTFQYPDHPEWGIESDEQEQLVGMIRRLRKMWPVVRLVQLFSPALRDFMRSFVWEEGGAIVGMTMAQREGTTSMWYIGTVGVLPEFRGRSIARQLVQATLDMMRERGGERVRLGVIDGNTPAQKLYSSLGLTAYGGSARYTLTPMAPVDRLTLPPGYVEERLREFDWRTRCELDQRITPAQRQAFEPITPSRYRVPLLMRALAVPFHFIENSRDRDFIIRRSSDRVVVARAGWSIVKRGKGMNSIRVRLDPACSDLAPYLVRKALSAVLEKSPDLRIDLLALDWTPCVAKEAEALGFVRRTSNKTMGMKL
ncbi:MAG: GNAT family N-acetyltransferase [Candidatus Bipolaricaulota bacterium]|nr:GNAT family N-acetyltransferase [Candidatus Bipolaricaulota bacterium]